MLQRDYLAILRPFLWLYIIIHLLVYCSCQCMDNVIEEFLGYTNNDLYKFDSKFLVHVYKLDIVYMLVFPISCLHFNLRCTDYIQKTCHVFSPCVFQLAFR